MKNFFDENVKLLTSLALAALIFFLFTQSFIAIADIKIRAKAVNPNNVITFRGVGEIEAKPDVATFNFTIREHEKDVALAQQKMTKKTNELLELLKKSVKKEDVKTENYATNPRYIYESVTCRKNICPPAKQVLQDYEATQTIEVKLRDIDKSGEILSAVAALGISEVNGPSFSIEDPSKLKSQAQALAIQKAKAEAKITAKNLGVSLGKIVRFSEEQNHNFMRPMMMGRAAVSTLEMESVKIEAGAEKVVAVVFITYEID